jgi:hypothetical protein
MAKRATGEKAQATPKNSGRKGALAVSIRCIECGSATTLTFPVAGRSPGAVFGATGWSVLNEPEEGHVVFACQKCFNEEMKCEEEEGPSRVRGEG